MPSPIEKQACLKKWPLNWGNKFEGTKIFHLYLEIKVISGTVKKRDFNIVKAWKNSGPEWNGCFMRFTLIGVDAKKGSYCILNIDFPVWYFSMISISKYFFYVNCKIHSNEQSSGFLFVFYPICSLFWYRTRNGQYLLTVVPLGLQEMSLNKRDQSQFNTQTVNVDRNLFHAAKKKKRQYLSLTMCG